MAIDSRRSGDNADLNMIRRRALGWTRLSRSVAVLLVALVAAKSSGQQYQADDVDENAGKLKLTAEQCVKNPARFATDRARFVEFFDKYYFPAMTRFSSDELGQLGRMRDDLFGRFLWASTDENLQLELTQMAFTKLQPVERNKGKNYHPAVRYNAVLILGMLDQTYPAPGRTPVPLEDATRELTMIVDYAADGKRVPPFLVVGALVGLQRHAQYFDKLDRTTAEGMAAALLKLANKDGRLAEADSKVAEWIRIQTAAALANIGNPGTNGEVIASLEKMIAGKTNPKTSLDGRTQVAALLPKFKLDGAKMDNKAVADALLELAVAVADDEGKEAKAFTNLQLQGGGFGGGYGAPGGKSSRMRLDAETQEWSFDKRILLTRLADLKAGLSAFRTIAPAEVQPTFDAVLAAINPAIATAESTNSTDIEVSNTVEQMAKNVRAAVKPGEPAPGDSDDNLF